MRKINLMRNGFVVITLTLVILALLFIWTNDTDMDKMVTIEAGTTNKGVMEIDYRILRPPTAIVFSGAGEKEIGRLDWTDGEFKFVGNADMSAKVFFDYFLKPYIDGYIEDELRRRKDE